MGKSSPPHLHLNSECLGLGWAHPKNEDPRKQQQSAFLRSPEIRALQPAELDLSKPYSGLTSHALRNCSRTRQSKNFLAGQLVGSRQLPAPLGGWLQHFCLRAPAVPSQALPRPVRSRSEPSLGTPGGLLPQGDTKLINLLWKQSQSVSGSRSRVMARVAGPALGQDS